MVAAYLKQLTLRKTGYPTYEAYLNGPHWKEFSSSVRQPRCYCCYRPKTLQVHHKTYIRLGEELPEDVITVCSRCHQLIHDVVRQGTPLHEADKVIGDRFGRSLSRPQPPSVQKRFKTTPKKWVKWFALINPSNPATWPEVERVLVGGGYATKVRKNIRRGYNLHPTNLAREVGLFKKNRWNRLLFEELQKRI